MAYSKKSLRKKRRKKQRGATYPRPENGNIYHIQPKKEERSYAEYMPEQEAPVVFSSSGREDYARRYDSHSTNTRSKAFSKKKRKKNSKSGRKKNYFVLRIAIASAILVVCLVCCVYILFKIATIQVVGNIKYSQDQIVAASELEPGENLYGPNSALIYKRLSEKLPYIKSVRLRHQLPDKLIIVVEEAEAKFAFKANTKYLLCDEELKLLELSDKLPEGATVIEGVSIKGAEIGEKAQFKDSEKGRLVSEIYENLLKYKLKKITMISVKNPVDIQAVFDDRITILFGQDDEIEYKCKIAAAAIQSALAENKKTEGTINVKQAPATKQAYLNP